MPTSFPSALDNFTNPVPPPGQFVWLDGSINDAPEPPATQLVAPNAALLHENQHSNVNDAVEALQVKVGIDSSMIVTSLDYQIRNHAHTGGDGTVQVDYGDLLNVPLTFPPAAHVVSHQNGGTDEISVLGLSGLLADPQTPLAHNLLSAIHGDTLTAAVVQGDLIIGNVTPKWSRLPIGVSGTFLKSDGNVPSWESIATGDIIDEEALTKVDDTNVTLTLGGSPLVALLSAVSLTLGWTGTLAAARLNANVVQSVVNDTNVTGNIAAQVLTLGWIGTLAVARGGTGAGALSDILGTTNQVNVANGVGRVIGGNVTLSLPQDIHTGAAPQFVGLTLTGNLSVQGNTTLGNAAADTVTVTATIISNLLFTDNLFDIGASGATRPRDVHVARDVVVGDDVVVTDDVFADDMFVSSASGNHGFASTYTGASSSSLGPQNSFTTNDGAAMAANDRLGALLFNGFDGAAVQLSTAIIVRASEVWSGTEWGSEILFLAVPINTSTIAIPLIVGGNFLTLADGVNVNLNTTTGTKFGTGTTQKLGFYNATPVVQQGATVDLGVALSNLGLRAAGTAYPITTSGAVLINGTTPFGYGTGAGGSVAQATNKATGVTLNTPVGLITTVNSALAADTTVSFTFTNSTIGANDLVILNIDHANSVSYVIQAAVAAGSAAISIRNITAGSLSDALPIRFAVIKGVIS